MKCISVMARMLCSEFGGEVPSDLEQMQRLPGVRLTVVLGRHAIAYHLPDAPPTLTQAVRDWRRHWPRAVPLPHPSPRNNLWLRRNPWFEAEVLPALRERVAELLAGAR